MKTRIVTADEARKNFSELLNTATYSGDRVEIRRREKVAGYLIGPEDMRLLEALEDRLDAEDAAAALSELERGEDETIPWKKAKKELRAKMTHEEFLEEARENGLEEQAGCLAYVRGGGMKGIVWKIPDPPSGKPDYRRFLDRVYADLRRKQGK
ncbi:MAG: type II toxin-antitoxin system Phd/YefM family antitoxin [Candidatus Tectomicrobia bacterium]|uniref:Antitoxin n=1 Tax=Tectimicrobiota bacterium TaxID=2528274 RepID=A0A932HZI5_UNCTE|nr:type II toxin-antitoxin system Phd/YefM family antitoxin [Candidatus Tectomicrobia bacterium]